MGDSRARPSLFWKFGTRLVFPPPFLPFDGPSASHLQEDGWMQRRRELLSCEAMPGDLSMIFAANAGTGDFPDRPAFWNGKGRPTAVKRRGGGLGGTSTGGMFVSIGARGIHGDGLEVVLVMQNGVYRRPPNLILWGNLPGGGVLAAEHRRHESQIASQPLETGRRGMDSGRKKKVQRLTADGAAVSCYRRATVLCKAEGRTADWKT
ncbi:hypothetical protein B0T18DRAFT_407148 [Schizothecium vesticola]|uniref:Uncharacterized protein n=1 Tax=Schizothecium vesticola TaxID=314040 RepID=A0AA40F1Q0_9PEZI|nr:hypothetical protein B0T18DRAFT_407148 [Schizothecium vesticola]